MENIKEYIEEGNEFEVEGVMTDNTKLVVTASVTLITVGVMNVIAYRRGRKKGLLEGYAVGIQEVMDMVKVSKDVVG